MRITDLLKKEGIALGIDAADREEAFDKLIDLQVVSGNVSDREEYKRGIMAREEQFSTAIGEGLAIPHAKNKAVIKPGLAAVTVPAGIDCNSMDGAPTKLIFMIAAPEKGGDVHLDVLANLNVILMDAAFRERLMNAASPEEFLKIVDEKETEKFGAAKEKADEGKEAEAHKEQAYRILAVTACPTGIAHTFMAAEALEQKAKEMGLTLKAETNGSGGAKNILTAKEIEEADGIIVAADKKVEMARFNGKQVLSVKVADGIHKPEELINKIVNGEAPVYHHEGAVQETSSGDDEGLGRKLYKHLMNGVSNMLPFVIGGGILIAIAFLLDDYSIDPSHFGTNTPLAAFFKHVGDTAFGFMLPILAGYIAMSIADRPGLAVGFVGGAIASSGMTLTSADGIPAGFLGALIAGFVGGWIVLKLEKICDHLPDSLEGIKPVLIYPLAGILLIGFIMCAINPAVSSLNTLLTNGLNSMGGTSKVLLGCIVAGMMSIDMGGPFNKAAYVFGTASIASGNYDIMAAVMIGGMIPPLAIALSTTFFKSRWTSEQRKSGLVNYIMGLCFISEGAIPYAAAEPLKIIPSCIVGSAVAGGISMFMGCTLRAPHGGIFVFPVVGNIFGYVIALVAGSVVGMLMIALLKKPLKKAE